MKVSPCVPHRGPPIYICDSCGTAEPWVEEMIKRDDGSSVCDACFPKVALPKTAMPAGKEHPSIVSERSFETEIEKALMSAGVDVRRQVRTSVGVADLVTANCVLEVKLTVGSRRAFHQAAGQARAYADALGLPHAHVLTANFAGKLKGAEAFGVRLFDFDDILEELGEMLLGEGA